MGETYNGYPEHNMLSSQLSVTSPIINNFRSGLVIDPTEKIATFLKYQNANCLTAVSPDDCIPEKIRLAVLGGIRYGKPVVIDVMDNPKMMNHIGTLMEEILPGLLNMIYDQSIKEEEKYVYYAIS